MYVWGNNISGELTMESYMGTSADFAGNLYYTGEGEPGITTLYAVVKGVNDLGLGTFEQFKEREYNSSYTGIATDITDAVKKFSYLSCEAANCDLSDESPYCDFSDIIQRSAFVSFDITLEDGTAAGVDIPVTVSSGSGENIITRTGTVETKEVSGAIKVQFTAAYPSGTTLSNATVTLGTRDAISFASSNPTLAPNKNYTVTKTYTRYKITASMNGEEIMSRSNKILGYETTLQELISKLPNPYNLMGNYVSNCVKKGNGTSVSVTPIANINPMDYTFTVEGEGDTDFTITITNVISQSFDITIGVSKMTPQEP